MPHSEKKTAQSPFIPEKGKAHHGKKAFKVVAGLAFFSFLMLAGSLYISYFGHQVPTASFNVQKVETPSEALASSLFNPQPPVKKKPDALKELADNAALIEELEKEKKTMEETAAVLQEIENIEKTDISAIEKIYAEQQQFEQKKLSEIERLFAEQKELEEKKIEIIKTLEEEKTASAADEVKAQEKGSESATMTPVQKNIETGKELAAVPAEQLKTPEASEKPIALNLIAPDNSSKFRPSTNSQKPVPLPEPIKKSLFASLPNFGAIKKAKITEVPLHIIDPLPELQKEGRYGQMPIKSTSGGNTPLQAYSRPVDLPPQVPYVAVLFSGLGKRANATMAAIASMPEVVSLSFSPYADNLKKDVTDARRAGHETLLDLPMQTGFFPETDPGPLGLVTGLPEQENRKRLHKVMGTNIAYIGLAATMNENFSYSSSQMKPFVDEIEESGLLYIAGTDDPRMPSFKNAIKPDIYISDNFYRTAIRAKLEEAKQIALKKGHVFIRVETLPISLLTVLEWVNSFTPTEEKQIPELTFVPLSYYAKQKRERND